MANEQRLIDAFNESLRRLEAGQSIADCRRAFPDVADELDSLLRTAQGVREVRLPASELSEMRQNLTPDIESLIENTEFSGAAGQTFPRGSLSLLAAALLVVTIGLLLVFSGDDDNVAANQTATANALLTSTAETVTPTSTVETVTPTSTVETVMPTSTVETVMPTNTVQTIAPTSTVETVMPTNTVQTIAPTATATAGCPIPDGWVRYRVRAGDTLSFIAVQSGATLDELVSANCIENTRLIVQGSTLYVPRLWTINDDDDSNDDDTGGGDTGNDDNINTGGDDTSDDDHSDDDDSDDDDDDSDDDDSDDDDDDSDDDD